MKKLIVLALVITVGFATTFCGSKVGTSMKGKSYRTGAWMDDNTFRIASRGAYPKNEDNPIVKEESAIRAAMLNAQYQILEKFAGSKFQGAAGMKNFRMSGIAAAQEVAGSISGGNQVSYKCDMNGCEVIYEVSSPGLKKKVGKIQGAK